MRLAILLLVLCSMACGGDPARRVTRPASAGVADIAAALRADDPARAYALLSTELQRELPYEQFAIDWKQYAAERAARAGYLQEELENKRDLGERAEFVYRNGKTVHLSRESDFWRIDAPMVSQYHTGRPHDAVEVFAQALSDRDFGALLRLLTDRRREGIGAQLDSFVKSLQAHLASPTSEVELIGDDRAEIRWDDGAKRYKLILRKEGEDWRVDDVQLQPTPAAKPDP